MRIAEPDPPENPRMTLPDGTEIPLKAVYEGADDNGVHQWLLTPSTADGVERVLTLTDPSRVRCTVDKVPPNTGMRVLLGPTGPWAGGVSLPAE